MDWGSSGGCDPSSDWRITNRQPRSPQATPKGHRVPRVGATARASTAGREPVTVRRHHPPRTGKQRREAASPTTPAVTITTVIRTSA